VRLCAELPFEAEQLRERHLRGDDLLARFVRPRLNLAPPHQKALEDGLTCLLSAPTTTCMTGSSTSGWAFFAAS
jgi:hypothetical protein